MGWPPEHSALIRRKGFPIPNTVPFDDEERRLISDFGYWLEALAKGTLVPFTPEQKQFVRVAHGEAEPLSAFEVAWVKYRHAADAVPPPVDPLELADRLTQLHAVRAAEAATRDEYNIRRDAILEQVRPQLEALEAEFADQIAATRDESARLEAEVRAAVLAYGQSFTHARIHAVYTRGRVTWDSKGLARFAKSYPEICEFRRVGQPSVSLRFESPPSLNIS